MLQLRLRTHSVGAGRSTARRCVPHVVHASPPRTLTVPPATPSPNNGPENLSALVEQLESSLAVPAVDAHRVLGITHAAGCSQQPLEVPAPAAAAAAATPQYSWGTGLSVPQFMAAVQALPMQRKVQWRSMQPPIGTGSRGKVYQAVNMHTGGMLAVKVVALREFLGPSQEAALRREALVLELAAMQDYAHPHLLAMKGFYLQPCTTAPRLEIYSELGCCLEDLLPQQEEGGHPLGLPLVQKVMQALLCALAYLHGQGVVHRDVKPGNIVSVGADGTFKLIDMDSIYFVDRAAQLGVEAGVLMAAAAAGSSSSSGGLGAASPMAAAARLAATGAAGSAAVMGDAWLDAPSTRRAATAAAGVAAARRRMTVQQVAGSPTLSTTPTTTTTSSSSSSKSNQSAVVPPPVAGPGAVGVAAAAGLNAVTHAGTPENMAPEAAPRVVEPQVVLWDLIPWKEGKMEASETPVDASRDIWSAGTVLYELLTGRPLFDQFDSPQQLYQHLESLASCLGAGSSQLQAGQPLHVQLSQLPTGTPPEALAVLEACLQVDPHQRATADQLLSMPFFTADFQVEVPC